MRLEGKIAAVTGGGSGMGKAISQAYAREGARVVVTDLNLDAARGVAEQIAAAGGEAIPVQTDVRDQAQAQAMVSAAVDTYGGLDVLVNNAGIAGPTGKVEEIDPEDWDRCLEVCITGQFNCTRLAVPHLKQSRNASIVNLSSAAGRFGFPLRTPYAAAKWAVIGFTKSLSRELGDFGIRVNAVLPGIVSGDRQRRVLEAKAQQRGISFAEMERAALANASLKEYVTPEQLADQIVFLCSPRGRTISGQAIAIDCDLQMLS